MLDILIFLVVFLLVYVVVGVAMAFIWTYLLNDKYWAWRERLEKKKQEKIKKQLQK